MTEYRHDEFRSDGPEVRERTFMGAVAPLIADLFEDLRTLMQQELSLARAELQEERERAQRVLTFTIIGIMLGVVAAGLLVTAIVLALQSVLTATPLWACFALVGGILGVVAIALHLGAVASWQRLGLIPHRTIASLKQTVRWR